MKSTPVNINIINDSTWSRGFAHPWFSVFAHPDYCLSLCSIVFISFDCLYTNGNYVSHWQTSSHNVVRKARWRTIVGNIFLYCFCPEYAWTIWNWTFATDNQSTPFLSCSKDTVHWWQKSWLRLLNSHNYHW
jgi:hypothetical protein